jgi:hypothetical protein
VPDYNPEPQIAVLDAGTPALGICHGLLAIALVSGVLSAGYLYGQPAVGSQIASIIPIEHRGTVPYAFRMLDVSRGWGFGDHASLVLTSDGGISWRKAGLGMIGPAWGITPDGGAWAIVNFLGGLPSTQLWKVDPAGRGSPVPTPCDASPMGFVANAAFDRTGNNGVVFGLVHLKGDTSRLLAFQTHDGGREWSPLTVPALVIYHSEFQAAMSDTGEVMLTTGCEFHVTADWGRTWRKSDRARLPAEMCGDTFPYTTRFVAGGRAWLRTYDGDVLYSDDSGVSWAVSSLKVKDQSYPWGLREWVSFADPDHGLMIVSGRVFATRDRGKHWVALTGPTERFGAVSCAAGRCLLGSDADGLFEVRFDR